MSKIKMKKVYLLNEDTLDEIFHGRNLAEVIEFLQSLTQDVPLDNVVVDHDTYYDESDKISIWYERPETEEEKVHRESLNEKFNKRQLRSELETFNVLKKKLTEAGLLTPDNEVTFYSN